MVSVGSLVLVCYFTNWAQYRSANKFLPESIDPNLCTHINYAFANLVNGELRQFEWNDDTQYAKVIGLKAQNPNLKILLSVGGWNMGSGVFSNMATDAVARANFVTKSIQFLKQYGFDGLDIDWEYPGSRDGSRSTDKDKFTQLLQDLRAAFQPYGYLLTAAVGVGFDTANAAYNISAISSQLDLINLMTYDLHGSWEPFTGHNAPLYARAAEIGAQRNLNLDAVIKYWKQNGADPAKLVLGLASYGRTFTLVNAAQNGLGASTSGAGASQPYTNAGGMASYYEVCNCLKNNWTRVYDNEQKIPYIYKGDQWIGYDDAQSLTEKANFILNTGIGGGMFWALDLDDFNGNFCGQGKYPLINKVKSILNNGTPVTTVQPVTTTSGNTLTTISSSQSPTTSKTPTGTSTTPATTKTTTASTITTTTTKSSVTTTAKVTTTTTKSSVTTTAKVTTTTTASSSKSMTCSKGDGFYALSGCQQFYRCVYSGTSFEMKVVNTCPSGTLFDANINVCNWPSSVTCKA